MAKEVIKKPPEIFAELKTGIGLAAFNHKPLNCRSSNPPHDDAMMIQTLGDFREDLPGNREFLILGFSPTSVPIQRRWRNNGLSADFVADYLTTFFPVSVTDSISLEDQTEIKGAVSYIANELLENAMKFSDETARYPINFGLHLLNEEDNEENATVILLVKNSVAAPTLEKFKSFVHEFLNSDTEELYIRRLEQCAEDEDSTTSGLGLLTMKNDYSAKLGWKIETVDQDPEVTALTTMAQLIMPNTPYGTTGHH